MTIFRKIRPVRILLLSAACVLLMLSFPLTAHADMGPKPSVQIAFTGMNPDALCYGTLLSERDSTGPSYVWDARKHPPGIRTESTKSGRPS